MITVAFTPEQYATVLDALKIADEVVKKKDKTITYSSFEDVYHKICLEKCR